MLRFLFKLAVLIFMMIVMAAFAARTLGSLRPLHPVMMGFEDGCTDQPQPCWYGIVLGKTTTSEVKTIFAGYGDSIYDNVAKAQLEVFKTRKGGCFAQFVYGRSQSPIINEIVLTNCVRVRLGDVLGYYGNPTTMGTGITCEANRTMIQHDHYFIEYPAAGILASINRPAFLKPWLSLQGNIRRLYLVTRHEDRRRKTWEGLIPFERFVRMHPEQISANGCWP